VDIPFYLPGRSAVSFSPYPYSGHVRYGQLTGLARKARPPYERVYLVVRPRARTEHAWRRSFGPFIADLMYGRPGDYPDVVPVAVLRDARVFEVRPAP